MTPEVQQLLAVLEDQRAGVVKKLFVEGKWLGGKPDRGLRSMTVDPSVTLRRAILAVIQETARHAGHADIIREQIDGQTGR